MRCCMKERDFKKIIKYGKVKKDVDLKTLTSFAIGGVAKWVIEPSDIEEFYKLVQLLAKKKTPYYILGNGTNVLFSDEGYDGVIIRIGNQFSNMQHDDSYFQVESGCSLSRFLTYACSEGYGGMEGLFGIPGTVGGGVRMNCGAFGYEIADHLVGVMYLDGDTLRYKKKEELELGYRTSWFVRHPDIIILRVDFDLEKVDQKQSEKSMQEYMQKRIEAQDLDYPSAGSVFKRNENLPAPVSKILDEIGLKGYSVGGAMISKKHAGFLINFASASSQNVLDLIQYVKNQVYAKYGVHLEVEIEIVGRRE